MCERTDAQSPNNQKALHSTFGKGLSKAGVKKMAKIQRLMIESQLAQIGVYTTPARLHITQHRPQMTITSESPTMEIERQAPTFRINRRRSNTAEFGARTSSGTGRNNAAAAIRQAAIRSSRAAVGDGSNTIGDTRRNEDSRPGHLSRSGRSASAVARARSGNIGSPSSRPDNQPEIVWDKGELSVNWSRHSILIDWDGEFMPEFVVDPKHSIEIYLRVEPYFRVSVEEMIVPGVPGVHVDQEV